MRFSIDPTLPQPAANTGADAEEAVRPAQPDATYFAKATRAAVEFESFFIGNMLHQMRESARTIAPEDSPSKDRVNQDMQDMVDGMLSKHLAGQRAFGVADAILKQILPSGFNKTG